MGIKICPQCGGKVSDIRTDCPHCQYDFTSVKKCPDCEEQIDVSLSECPVCGHFFENERYNKSQTSISLQEEKLVNDSQIAQSTQDDGGLTCPYCGSNESIEIGIDSFMCAQCKNKFLTPSLLIYAQRWGLRRLCLKWIAIRLCRQISKIYLTRKYRLSKKKRILSPPQNQAKANQ